MLFSISAAQQIACARLTFRNLLFFPQNVSLAVSTEGELTFTKLSMQLNWILNIIRAFLYFEISTNFQIQSYIATFDVTPFLYQ